MKSGLSICILVYARSKEKKNGDGYLVHKSKEKKNEDGYLVRRSEIKSAKPTLMACFFLKLLKIKN